MLRSFMSRAAAFAAIWCAFNAVTASAQAVTAVEYYNKVIDAYFLTARANEQVALDGVADFQRTGMTFQAVAAASATAAQTRICRFYISTTTPHTSSHFYGRQGTDCEFLLTQNLAGFTCEDYDHRAPSTRASSELTKLPATPLLDQHQARPSLHGSYPTSAACNPRAPIHDRTGSRNRHL